MKNFDYYSILSQNIPGLEVLLIDNSYKLLCKLGTEAQKQGWEVSNEANKNILTVFPKEIKDILAPLLKIGFESTPISREFEANGNYFSVRIIPLKEAYNESLCILILQNITETKLAEKKLKNSMNEAKEANKAKDNFVAKMSHEIRTPLNAINGFTEQLEKTRLTKKQADYLNIVSNASKHLLSIIDDVLILSKIELGQIDHEMEPFKISTILKEIDDVLKIKYEAKNLIFNTLCDCPADEILIGEPSKLRQILINLTNNAIKFTKKGSVSINCILLKNSNHQISIDFVVTDTGIGIDADEIKNIFKPFHQIDLSFGRKYAGCGLGLTISKELVESMGGKIDVKSKPGKGSTFKFSLNFRKARETDIISFEKEEQIKGFPLDQIRILFVDDDPVNLLLGRVILNKFGVKADFSNSGSDALKKFKSGKYDILFLDINMPGINGWDVTKRIRKAEKDHPNGKKTRIIAMTANVLKRDIESYMQAGIDSVILKPYQEETIYRRIVAYATKTDKDHTTDEINLLTGKSKDYDLGQLLNFTKGDSEFTVLILDTFIESAQHSLEKIESAFRLNDYSAIAETAHKLIPSVEQLGLKKNSRLLKKIEQRYLRKEKFKKDPILIETAISELQKGIKSISEYKTKFTEQVLIRK